MRNILIASLLILVAVLSRTVFHLGPNFEMVTSASIIGGYILKNSKLMYLVPLLSMIVTDSIIGNTNIVWFTWSAFLFAPLMGKFLNKLNVEGFKKLLLITSSSLLFVVIFFLWTNLGVVVTTNMYTKDLDGLMLSYINALPFIKPQLISALVTTPILFIAVMGIDSILKQFKLNRLTKLDLA